MKKLLFFALSVFLLLTGCAPSEAADANSIMAKVREHRELLLQCVEEMEAFGLERVYVAMELPEVEEAEQEDGTPTASTQAPLPRLVSFEKESDERAEIENPILQEALETLGLELIFFQTASDSRQTVIFSYTRESDDGVQRGFYYSYDTLPAGWWGRRAELKRKDHQWLQLSENGDAWYYTLQIEDSFYYFEKQGELVA